MTAHGKEDEAGKTPHLPGSQASGLGGRMDISLFNIDTGGAGGREETRSIWKTLTHACEIHN